MSDVITRRDVGWIAVWAVAIALLYALAGYYGVRALHAYKAESEPQTMAGAPATEASGVPVKVGVYVNGITDFVFRDGTWTEDFDIWFRWTDPRIKPGETFDVVNGTIDHREKIESSTSATEQYERYRVKAHLTKSYDPGRFPFGDESLPILVEDDAHPTNPIRYIVDEGASGVSEFAVPSRVRVTKSVTAIQHERFLHATFIAPPSWALYFRNFQALYLSVAIALIVFFIKPKHVDPRFGLGVGAVFAAIANNSLVVSYLPPSTHFTLTAMINATCFGTIFLTLVQSTISLYMLDSLGRIRLYKCFDRVSFCVFLAGCVAVNVCLPLAAS